jgi:hypothetical protein
MDVIIYWLLQLRSFIKILNAHVSLTLTKVEMHGYCSIN